MHPRAFHAALDEKYGAEGLRILAFPCNQFGAQEPDSAEEIRKFVVSKGLQLAKRSEQSSFVLMGKTDVNGAKTHPVFRFLKALAPKADIDWNFGAYWVVDRSGRVLKRADGSGTRSTCLRLVPSPLT